METKAANFDDVRAEYGIANHYSDAVLAAFAENWFRMEDVEWQEFEGAYWGDFGGSNDDEAIGECLHDIAAESGDLEGIPEYILCNVDWEAIGRDARFNGEFRASPLSGYSATFAVFSNW